MPGVPLIPASFMKQFVERYHTRLKLTLQCLLLLLEYELKSVYKTLDAHALKLHTHQCKWLIVYITVRSIICAVCGHTYIRTAYEMILLMNKIWRNVMINKLFCSYPRY